MKILLFASMMFFHILEGLAFTVGAATWFSQDSKSSPSAAIQMVVKLGVSDDGTVDSQWLEAIRERHDEGTLSALLRNQKQLSQAEIHWANLIQSRVSEWSKLIASLQIPFYGIAPPAAVSILLGNQGGEDAFVSSHSTICFDLGRLHDLYGSASETINRERIDRFFAHEFTHLMHKVWRQEHRLKLETPLDYALWECLTEGMGNYRSLSAKWLLENGELTRHAEEVLSRLQPIFAERIAALAKATDVEASQLMAGLSSGAFDQKWGALTVALWLAKEANGDDQNLRKWVDAGPTGILVLAQKYLPEDLKAEMPRFAEQ